MESLNSMLSSVEQFITQLPIWFSAPLIFLIAIPLCFVVAVVTLRVIDSVGGVYDRIHSRIVGEEKTLLGRDTTSPDE